MVESASAQKMPLWSYRDEWQKLVGTKRQRNLWLGLWSVEMSS